jgi:hypothetical protein
MMWDYSVHQPVWWATLLVGSILGAILGALIPTGIFHTLISYLRRAFRQDDLLGTWYYYSGGYVNGRPQPIRECRYEVKRAFFSQYSAYSFFPVNATVPVYTATIHNEHNDLIEIFRNEATSSSGYCRFTRPTHNYDRLYGFWCSGIIGDTHHVLACGLIMFCRERIEQDRVEQELQAGFEFHGDIPSMIRLRASHGGTLRVRPKSRSQKPEALRSS